MLGAADGALGVGWPSMQVAFGRPISDLGLVLAFGSLGYLSSSSSYGWVHARTGTGNSLVAGVTLMAFGLIGIAFAGFWEIIIGSALIFGVGGGLVDAGLNAHAALEFDSRSINLLHAAYGAGATMGPIVVTLGLTAGGQWRAGYVALSLVQVALIVAVWAKRGLWSSDIQAPDDGQRAAKPRWGIVLLSLLLFLVYTGVEVAAGQWGFTLLSQGRGLAEASAGLWVAAYWGGLTAGRLLLGFVGVRFDPSRLLDLGIGTTVVGLAFLWWDPGGFGHVALPLTGLGLAGVFPALVSLTPLRIGKARSTRMVGFQLSAANIGAASIPWTIGLVASESGLTSLGPALFAGAVVLALLHFIVQNTTRIVS